MTEMKLAFIGAGNIALAIIGGLVEKGFPAGAITAADPSDAQRARLPAGVRGVAANADAVDQADVIVLCVKPGLVASVCGEIAGSAGGALIVSVAAGVTTGTIVRALGHDSAVIRCMPNTPALVGLGMTGLFATSTVTSRQRRQAETLTSSVGDIAWFDEESQLDAVTAVSGSGPAYFFLVMEAMEAAAVDLGLPPEVSRQLVLQTARGAAEMAARSDQTPSELRVNVTSPGGTTEAALNALIEAGLPAHFRDALIAARNRSVELSGS